MFISWFFLLPVLTHSQLFNPVLNQGFNQITLSGTLFGCGLSCFDVNHDGWDDLTIGGKNTNIRLLINQDGIFVPQNLGLYFPYEVKGLVWADYDNDGDEDLAVSLLNHGVKLYRNNGSLGLTDVSSSAGIVQEATENWGLSWGDVNNDGYLDLYICKYANHLQGQSSYARKNHLYLNNGNGTFTDITLSAGLDDGIKLSFQALFIDYNSDGFQDIYVINDKIYPNSLYQNNGDLSFTEVGLATNANITIDAMSASPGDWNNDLLEDIYITNTAGGNALLVANETNSYMNHAPALGVQVFHECWGANWLDGDNDGDMDLYVGSSSGINGGNPNHYFENNNGEMNERCINEEFPDAPITHASGIFDLNNDGFVDLVNHNASPSNFSIWQNAGNENHFIKIGLQGVLSNRNGIGTQLDIFSGGVQQRRRTYCGESYLTQNSQYEIVGLDTCSSIDSLKIHWLSGVDEVYYELEVDSFYRFKEGESFKLKCSLEVDNLVLCTHDSIEICVNGMHSQLWSTGDTSSCITSPSNATILAIGNSYGAFFDTLSFEIGSYPPTQLELAITNPSCHETATGEIIFENLVDFLELFWDDQALYSHLHAVSPGTYNFNWIDLNTCRDSMMILIESPQPLEMGMEIVQGSYDSENNVMLIPSGGIPPYSVSWSNNSSLWEAGGLSPGEYTISLIDANLCSIDTTFVLEQFTAVNEQNSAYKIYPNPSSNALIIELPDGFKSIVSIHDNSGKLVKKSLCENQTKLDISHLKSGSYTLNFEGEITILPQRFVKVAE